METNDATKAQVGQMETKLKWLGAKLDKLVTRVEGAGAEAKSEYGHRIDELKTKRAAAQAKLDEIRTAGSDRWEILKGGFHHAWNDLELAFRDLKQASEAGKPGAGPAAQASSKASASASDKQGGPPAGA